MMENMATATPSASTDAPQSAAILTDRQASVLAVVTSYCQAMGEPCPSTYIARRLSLHHSTIQDHLRALHRKGWLTTPNAPALPRRR